MELTAIGERENWFLNQTLKNATVMPAPTEMIKSERKITHGTEVDRGTE